MRLSRLLLGFTLCLACESEPIQPGNEPENHVTNFNALVQSSTSIMVTWEDAPEVDKYFVQAKTSAGSFHSVTDGLLNADDTDWGDGNATLNISQNTKQALFTGLVSGTSYEFMIHPYNQGIAPDPDYKTDGTVPTASASTPVEVAEPAAHVTEFTATALSNASIKVTWSDAADVHKYLVLAKTGSGTFANVTDGTSVSDDTDWSDNNGALNISQGTQEATFNGLDENTAYEFLIYPFNQGGSTDPDFKTDGTVPSASTTTMAGAVEPPSHVTEFGALALSSSSIKVSWTDATGANKYLVLAKTGAGVFTEVVDGTAVADDTDWSNDNGALNISQGTQEATFSGLTAETGYNFIIYPYSQGGSVDPDYKTDGTVPEASATTTSSSSTTFDKTLVTETMISVSGTPFDISSYPQADLIHPQVIDPFSYEPKIVISPNASGGYSIGWFDLANNVVKITNVTDQNLKDGTDFSVGTDISHFGGLAINGTEFIIGYVSGANAEKYSISEVSVSGSINWTTELTGTEPLEQEWSKQRPIDFGSARIVVDQIVSRISVFLSHEMRWDDGTNHQGGLFKFLDFDGTIQGGISNTGSDAFGGNNWFISHNIDTRLVSNGGKVTAIGIGDAAPRAIAGRVVSDGTWVNNTSIFGIDGNLGDNDVKSQMGGLIAMDNEDFILTFSSEVGRSARDVNFNRLGSDLASTNQIWLTQYSSGTNAINVKTAKYGDYFLVAWEEISDTSPGVFKAMFSIVDADGNFIKEPQQFADMRFNRGDDFINLADGDVVWATGSGSQLVIYRLDYDANIFN